MMFYHWTILDSVIIYIASIQMSLKLKILLILKKCASYLEFHVEIDNGGRLKTKLYDKRDDFTFPIGNFPFISSNIPASPTYGVYISQFKRYSRACAQYNDLHGRVQVLTQMLLKQDYVAPRLKSLLHKLSSSQSGWPLRNIHISNDNGSFTFT